MSCNPTRIELSNDATTTVSFTVTPAPTGTVVIYFDVPGLTVDTQANLSSGSASIDIPAVSGDTNSIYDATIQVGTGAAIAADVQVVDSSSAQAVGVTVSGSSVTYCAPTGGGGGDDPIQDRTYSKNLDIVAQDMISGETSVMILGDSINNPQSLTFMKYGYMNKWKPNYWRGLNVALSDGAAGTNGFQVAGAISANVTGNAQSTGPDPENSFFGSSDHSGKSVQPNAALTALMVNSSTNPQVAATIRPVWNPSGSSDFPTPGTGYLHEWKGEMQSEALWYGERIRYRVQFYTDTSESVRVWWRWGTDGESDPSPATQIVDYTPSQGFNTIISPVVDNSAATGTAVGTCDVYMQGSSGTQNMTIIGIVAEDIDAPGLSLSYMGGGGWKTANHALDDDTAPGTGSGNTGDRAAYYEDTAAQNYLEFMNTDVVMIHIGANDPDVSGVSDYLPSVLTRFRSLKTGIKFLLVAQYNTNGDANQVSRWDAQSTYMRGLAGSSGNEDVAFLDLNKMVLDEVGEYSEWGATTAPSADKLLVDGIHPNAAGSDKFAELEWDEIVAAAEAAGSEASWPSKGSSELTTVGTVTTGRWSASPVALDHGGTGSVTAADARKALGVTNTGSYTGQIETADDKTYTLDPGVVAPRTITGFYIKSDSGTCTANLKVGSDVVRTASVSTSSGDQTPLAYTEVDVDDVITLVISSNSSATDVTFSVEYTS